MYQNQILQESGNLNKALKHLEEYSSQIVDKLAVNEIKGDLCLKLGNYGDAVEVYKQLIERNPENKMYYEKYIEAAQVKTSAEKIALYKKFQVL